jgi:uncharacterized protein YllA (UPF0747 family)
VNEPGCYRLPLDRYPGMNRFVLDWMAGDERFLPRHQKDIPRQSRKPSNWTTALIESNRRWHLDVADEVTRWTAGQTFTIVAGQQVGFAGGPLYTLVKLASLLKLKRENESRGIPTTVFFWLATEDHDFNEAAQIALPSRDPQRQLDLLWLRATRSTESRQVVGRQPVPESLIQELTGSLAMRRPAWLRSGISFADSFAELLAAAVEGKFILVDALLPELRQAGAPLFEEVVRRWDQLQSELAARSSALKQAGYTPQIEAREGEPYTFLYRLDERGNRQLLAHPSQIDAPETISTSAVTRPLLQDFLFRPDLFVGGPAEVAYYAQLAPLHRLLEVPLPRIALRSHVLVAPQRVMRYFSRYGVQPDEVFTTPDRLAAAHNSGDAEKIRSIAGEAQQQLNEHIDKIRTLALPADHAVARSIHRSIGHIDYHFKKLTERAIRGLVRKDKERFQAFREIVSTFYPDQHVQDRVVGWLPYWCEYGKPFVDRLIDENEPDTPVFKMVGL